MDISILPLVFAGLAFAADRGAEFIDLQGRDFGSVQFTHLLHQINLGDCEVCHKLYPMETDGIEERVRAGALTRRQVMDNCMDCHRKTALAGKKSGSTSCRGCHSE